MEKTIEDYKIVEKKVLKYYGMEPIEDEYSVCDGIKTENGKTTIVEFKYRLFESWRYETHFLEVDKYKNLIKLARSIGGEGHIYYSNLFTDGIMLEYDLIQVYKALKENNIDFVYSGYMYLNKSKVWNREKVKKHIYYLNSKYGKKIKI